jgi:hypothetical protein
VGPKVQLPSGQFVVDGGFLSVDATALLSALQSIAFYSSRSGATVSRPTGSSFRWIGMPYFDTTLGLPVFLKTASSNAWVKADGTPA